ncbi:MAG: hypothetical protein AB7V04_05600 [Desulfomonilaceae bacterium]
MLIDSIERFEWTDKSIPYNRAIEIATGKRMAGQMDEFLHARISAINEELGEILQLTENLGKEAENLSNILGEIAYFERLDTLLNYAKTRLSGPELDDTIRKLSGIGKKYRGCDPYEEKQKVADRKESIIAELDHLSVKVDRLSEERERCKQSIREHQLVLGVTGKPRDNAIFSNPNLALAIHNKIADSQIVLIIPSVNSAYRQWIEYEYQEAFVLGKPCYGLISNKTVEELPADLKKYGVMPLPWSKEDISGIFKSLTP